jgi:hypothetical protein
MTPAKAIAISFAIGAAAIARDEAPQSVGAALRVLQNILASCYPQLSLLLLEQDPASATQRAAVEKQLDHERASENEATIKAAHALNNQVMRYAPQVVTALALDFTVVAAANLCLNRLGMAFEESRRPTRRQQQQQQQQQQEQERQQVRQIVVDLRLRSIRIHFFIEPLS